MHTLLDMLHARKLIGAVAVAVPAGDEDHARGGNPARIGQGWRVSSLKAGDYNHWSKTGKKVLLFEP